MSATTTPAFDTLRFVQLLGQYANSALRIQGSCQQLDFATLKPKERADLEKILRGVEQTLAPVADAAREMTLARDMLAQGLQGACTELPA